MLIKNNLVNFNRIKLLLLIFIFFLPWGNNFNTQKDYPGISSDKVGYFQTNTCEFNFLKLIQKEFLNKNIEVKPDLSSSMQCHGLINGVDEFPEITKVYIGTNINLDLLIQSFFYLLILSLIPKKEVINFKKGKLLSIWTLNLLFYLHLKGESIFYESNIKNFNLDINFENYFLFSLIMILSLTIYLIYEILETRFFNLINYLPFIMLFHGAFNSFNLNFYLIFFSILGIHALLEKKIHKIPTILFLMFFLIQIVNFKNKNILFDVDKLKGFINSAQTLESFIFWNIVVYLFLSGFIYLLDLSISYLDLNKFLKNLIYSGSIISLLGIASGKFPIVNFLNYYFLGLNKLPVKNLTSVEGNAWRGISASAESIGEFYALIILLFIIIKTEKREKIYLMEVLMFFPIIYGIVRSNNVASITSAIFIIFIYFLQKSNFSVKRKFVFIAFLSSLPLIYLNTTGYSYEAGSKTLLQNGYIATDFSIDLPGDQNGNTAVDNLNFAEILNYPKDSTNISNALYYLTNEYTNSGNIKFLPDKVALISNVSLPINRSEKWGIFIAKYNPNLTDLLFGYGTNQLSEYYLGHKTLVNSGLVLPHSSFLDLIIFYGLLGTFLICAYVIRLFINNKKNIIYFSITIFLLLNLLKSDTILYLSSFLLYIFLLNFHKVKNNE